MHKVNSPVALEPIVYKAKPSGIADVWLRRNVTEFDENEEEAGGFEADEIFFRVTAEKVPEMEILADADFWFESLAESEEGILSDWLSIEDYRESKKKELSDACHAGIIAGVDVSLPGGTEHFSLKETDQLNLFGKQAQLAAGLTRLEYHQDGEPCKYYSAEEMGGIIDTAMYFVSYQTTYCNSMYAWLEGCSRASEMARIHYGMEVPEEYQSEVLRDYINA